MTSISQPKPKTKKKETENFFLPTTVCCGESVDSRSFSRPSLVIDGLIGVVWSWQLLHWRLL
jgi:hypothetical protein